MRARALLLFVAVAIMADPAVARPFVFGRAVLNAASFSPPGLANGSIAQGSIFSVFGRDLGPVQGVQVSSFPLAEELAAVSLDVCAGDACVPALPLFVRADQINAIMPSNAPLGPVSLRVTFEDEPGNFVPVEVVESSVGVFAVNSGGTGPAVAQNFVAPDNQPVNSGLLSARRGQVVTLWATGLGPAPNADNVAPTPGTLPVDIEIWVGGARVVNKLYSGRSPCCAGVDQIVFEIPGDAPSGCWVPVHVQTAGRLVSNAVTLAIGDGGTCSDPHNPFQPTFTSGGRLAAYLADRHETAVDVDGMPTRNDSMGWVQVYLREEAASGFAFDRILSLPPVGSCTTQGLAGDAVRDPLPASAPSVRWLDGGPRVDVVAPDGTTGQMAAHGRVGGVYIGGTALLDMKLLMHGMTASLASEGGADVGPLTGTIESRPAPTWTNRRALRSVQAGGPIEFRWTVPADASPLLSIVGTSTSKPNNVSSRFFCIVDSSLGAFTVPAWATANLPAATRRRFEADAVLGVGLGPVFGIDAVSAAGVDIGALVAHVMVCGNG